MKYIAAETLLKTKTLSTFIASRAMHNVGIRIRATSLKWKNPNRKYK